MGYSHQIATKTLVLSLSKGAYGLELSFDRLTTNGCFKPAVLSPGRNPFPSAP